MPAPVASYPLVPGMTLVAACFVSVPSCEELDMVRTHEELLAGNRGPADSLADSGLVMIVLGRVEVTIPGAGGFETSRGVGNLEDAEPEARHLVSWAANER
jgi:hypothetical protein